MSTSPWTSQEGFSYLDSPYVFSNKSPNKKEESIGCFIPLFAIAMVIGLSYMFAVTSSSSVDQELMEELNTMSYERQEECNVKQQDFEEESSEVDVVIMWFFLH